MRGFGGTQTQEKQVRRERIPIGDIYADDEPRAQRRLAILLAIACVTAAGAIGYVVWWGS
jgi:hypothetical protein